MRQVINARVRGSMVIALAIAAPACAMGEGGSAAGDSGPTGSLQAAITVGGSRHDVTSVYYKIISASSACSDPAIAETTSSLEEEALPGSVLPPGAGTHAGADGLFVLPPGEYRVCATPMSDNGPSLECAPTEGTALVIPEATTEIVLVSQCAADANGGVDVGVALNDPPQINDIDVAPSKFITECETATITMTAEDPDGDAISYTWELIAGAGTLSGADNTATFTPTGAGDATVKVTVTDALGGSAALTFPIHVSAEDCGTGPSPTCSDGIQNQGETGVDCGGPCAPCGGGSAVFTFTDTPADDVSSTALFDFFTNLGPVNASQYIMVAVDSPGSGGAWCADNADFYVNTYLGLAGSSGSATSGNWGKYTRSTGGSWSGPDTTGWWNSFGNTCTGAYSWCSFGSKVVGVMPGELVNGESYVNGWSGGAGWVVSVAVGADRLSTCGF